jgi:hypothetical protein
MNSIKETARIPHIIAIRTTGSQIVVGRFVNKPPD